MASTCEHRIINTPIHFCDGLDPIDSVRTASLPQTYDGSLSLPISSCPVSETISQSTDVCPSCQMTNYRKRCRHCTSCRLFYHLAGAHLKKAKSSSLRTWLCHRCLFPENAFLTAVNSKFYVQTSDGRAGSEVQLARCVDNADIILKRIPQLRRFYRIPIRIPKYIRISVAEALPDAIDRTLTSESNTECNSLVVFPILALGIPISPNTTGSSPSSIIRANLRRHTQSPADLDTLCQQMPCHQRAKRRSHLRTSAPKSTGSLC